MTRLFLLGLMVVPLLLACGQDTEGPRGGGGSDGGGQDGGEVQCPSEGAPCQPSTACRIGRIACAGQTTSCVPSGSAPDGTVCGSSEVCSAGACVACVAGATCVPGNPCERGTLSCSTGAPVCSSTGARHPAGSSCGNDKVCNPAGACVDCASGEACAASNPCRAAAIECSTGAPVCTEHANLLDGTACGDDKVCRSGACVSCTQGMSCTPSSNPCHEGRLDCVTGACVDTGVTRANGASCGFDSVCSEGACRYCPAGDRCTPTDLCHVGRYTCETGQPVCTDSGAPQSPGTRCGTDQVCNPTGTCIACQESAACESPHPCRTAAIRCGSGGPVCTPAANRRDGTSCGSNNVCVSGTCAACPMDSFTVETVDSGGYGSASMGFARGADGAQHAAYYDASTRAYYYATDASGTWVRQRLMDTDANYGGDVYLALDPGGRAHVSLARGPNSELWYATNASGTWEAERVSTTRVYAHRIAVDTASNPHIVFGGFRNGTYPYHASRRGGLWRIGRIDDSATMYEDTPALVAAQDGSLHASWTAGGKLRHAWFRGVAWDVEEVAAAPGASMRLGRGTAIAVDAALHVHIAYTYGATSIQYATNASGGWVVATAAPARVYNPDPSQYYDIHLDGGAGVSIALDQQGHVHIAWVALPVGYGYFLNLATNASGAWVNKPYVWLSPGLDSTSLFVDENGKLRVGYSAYHFPDSPTLASQPCPGPTPGLPPLVAAPLPEVVRTPTACDGCVPSVVAVGTPGGMRVEWRPVTGAAGYTVYIARGEVPTKANHATLPDGRAVSTSGRSLELTGLAVGESYFAVVTAVSGSDESAESPPASAIPVADIPGEGFSAPTEVPFITTTRVLANAGDVDQDGYDDLIVGDDRYGSGRGQVRLFHGGEAGLSQTPAWTVTGVSADSTTSSVRGTRLGVSVAAAGDVNGDGYADVAVAEERGVRIYHGSASGLSTTPARTLTILSSSLRITGGDFNGDGFGEVAVGNYLWNREPFETRWDGAAYVYPGGASGTGASASWTQSTLPEWTRNRFGEIIAAVGDVDGDGFGDLLVGSPHFDGSGTNYFQGALLLFRGSASGLAQTASWRRLGRGFEDRFGYAVAGLGDMDGDTYGEVAIGAPHRFGESRVDFYEGVTGGLQPTPFRTFTTSAWPHFGSLLEARIDFLNDGTRDLLVGALARVALYRGRAQSLDEDPVWSLEVQPGESTYDYIADATAGRFGGPGGIGIVARGCGETSGCSVPWGVVAYATGKAQGPRVDAGWATKGVTGAMTPLSGAGLRRGGGTSSCTVDFGDGSSPRTLQPCGDMQVGALAHRYWLPGRYTVTLTLDSGESVSSTTIDVTP